MTLIGQCSPTWGRAGIAGRQQVIVGLRLVVAEVLPHPLHDVVLLLPRFPSPSTQHPTGPQPLIELDAIYNTEAPVMEMAWKMNGPKRWDFLNFLREIILEREKEKPICSFSCMGLPPSFSGLPCLCLSLPLSREFPFAVSVFLSLPLFLLLSHSCALFTSNRFPFLKGQKTWFTLSPASIIGAAPLTPSLRRLNCMRKGKEGWKVGVGAQFPQTVCTHWYWRTVYSRINVV
jgi:hypothetical protein